MAGSIRQSAQNSTRIESPHGLTHDPVAGAWIIRTIASARAAYTKLVPVPPTAPWHRRLVILAAVIAALGWPPVARAQETPPTKPPDVREHVAVTARVLTPTRETTGTSWLPEATPMYGVHRPWRRWDLRVDGVVFVQALYEPGDRHRTGGAGNRQGGSVNWGMFMARRTVGAGRFGVRTMFSAEPWTVRSCGALSFLATGEVCDGDTIHDRQQAHDLVMELAVDYDRALRGGWRWQVFAALAGEPALGPPGYLHRASATNNPLGPIAHHWLDSTHAFGLVTGGVHNHRWKAEVSAFNGREADESRADVDLGAFDSVAGRVSFLPSARLALQVSAARMRDVRTEFPFADQDPVVRFTTSAVYHVPLPRNGIWATTAAFGANRVREVVIGDLLEATSRAALIESSVTLSGRHTLFGRAEIADMPAHHLHAHEYFASVFAVGKMQVGYVRHLNARNGLVPGIGGTFALSVLPSELASRYSGRAAPSVGVFFSLKAARHGM